VDELTNSFRSPAFLLRAALVVILLALLFGPDSWRTTLPIWIPFLILGGLEAHFFLGALRSAPSGRPDRGPQPVDKELYGYPVFEEDSEEPEEPWDEGDDPDEEEEEEPYEPEPRRSHARPVRRLLAGLAVIGGLAILLWVVDSRTGWNGLSPDTRADAAARFSAEASLIAGKPVTIRCDESGEHVGVVQHADGSALVGGDVAYLTPERCLDLYRLAFKGEVNSSQTARAVSVLAHESWHLRGVANEGETECFALQSGVELGRRLSLSEERARQMMRQQLAENALRGGAGLEYVVPPECHDGGSLDLHPASTQFP
jgi:hypothetical protein